MYSNLVYPKENNYIILYCRNLAIAEIWPGRSGSNFELRLD